jgi:hypothetical protein
MKIDGLDWMDWLHRLRAESEAERKRQGLSIAGRLARAEKAADAVLAELAATQPVARDKPAGAPEDRNP